MALTMEKCEKHIRHTLHGPTDPTITVVDIVNQAGEYLVSMHDWAWLERRIARLDMRARIDFTGATWVELTKTLTSTGSFTAYTQLAGDEVMITDGTDTLIQTYRIVSKTNNTLVLAESLQTTGGTASAISGTLLLDSLLLPSDLREIIAINATEGLQNKVVLTTFDRLLAMRTSEISLTSRNYFAAVVNAVATDGTVVPLLEVYPEPTTEQLDGMSLFYRAGWARVSADTTNLTLPVWLEQLFLFLVRLTARGYEEGEEEDSASIHARLAELSASPMMAAALRADGVFQPDYGPVTGGAVEIYDDYDQYLRTPVQGPA